MQRGCVRVSPAGAETETETGTGIEIGTGTETGTETETEAETDEHRQDEVIPATATENATAEIVGYAPPLTAVCAFCCCWYSVKVLVSKVEGLSS